ncbi:hypothetical protein TCAL_02229 [Tigriopus californicus]|uniref:LIM zinc-binding domain-containing protein n=1 Tax=Tigriopus californicus TaxID=6832 RepID=A0A553P701_TIGCA|nr:hypothetical protein TCAL_02229 [Tigriopus californicus]
MGVVDLDKCPKCETAVYEAESFPAGKSLIASGTWESLEIKRLDSVSVRVHDGLLYCKACHKKTTPEETPKIYPDTTAIAPKDEKGCPRCGGAVYEAEKVSMKEVFYHKKCFTCHRCTRHLDALGASVAPDNEVYCKVCFKVVTAPERPQYNTDTTILMAEEEKDGCPRCGGKVFEAEKMIGKTGPYHKRCFFCKTCKRTLDYQIHQLEPGNVTNGPDFEIYCDFCYKVTFGHKAPTKSMPLDTTSIEGQVGDRRRCPRCCGKVFEAEKMVTDSGWYHRHCFRCNICTEPLDSLGVCDGPDGKIYCRVCYGRIHGNSNPKFYNNSQIETYTIQAGAEDNPCPRCNGKVFEAEKMMSTHHVYHKRCFSCRECQRRLDPFAAQEAPDGEIVCRVCYERQYGVVANPLSGADMLKLLDTALIKGKDDQDKEVCPRCTGKVFHAERVEVKGRVYHNRCASCARCNKPLSSKDICDGKDNDIYCKSCYARKYGAPGYRGAGCGDWTDADSADTLRPIQDVDVSKIKGVEGDPDTCPRCRGKIFETERKASTKHYWHKKCFNCFKCHRGLDETHHYIYDAPDNEIYCKDCFKKSFPSLRCPSSTRTPQLSNLLKKKEDVLDVVVLFFNAIEGPDDEAEEVNIKNNIYHKRCLSCKNCKRNLDISILAIGPDDDIYCSICCHKISWPNRYQGACDTSLIPGEDGEPTNCPRCHGKVFEAERMSTKKALYHKKCFTCIKCKSALGYFSAIEGPDDEAYCKVCYLKNHGPGGKNKYGDKTHVDIDESDPEACIRCKGKVFDAEKYFTKSGVVHKFCLSCNECKSNLDASSFFNGGDGEIYCKHCYAVKFGHKQKSDYTGWMDVKAIQGEAGDKQSCPRCTGKVFEAERMVTRVGSFHRNCFSCIDCNRKLDSTTCCEGPDGEIYCKSCYSFGFGTKSRSRPKNDFRGSRAMKTNVPKMFQNNDDMLARSSIETWVIKAEKDDPNCCPKCDGKVYDAEKMVTAAGTRYHKNCFRCIECLRLLDSLTANDGPDGNLYCKMCYNKQYGPHTRSSDIDHKLNNTALIKSQDDKKNCPRCGGAVFKAEEIASHGKSFHKKCASCAACAKKLDHATVTRGADNDIYCRSCYGRKFAGSGYRGAGCSNWVDKDASDTLRHSYQFFSF